MWDVSSDFLTSPRSQLPVIHPSVTTAVAREKQMANLSNFLYKIVAC